MKNIIVGLLFIISLNSNGQVNNQSKSILMVLSSYGKDQGEERPGYEFDEFSQAYLIFTKNGISVDVASPKGGKVYPDKFNSDKAYNKAVIENAEAMELLNKTKPISSVKSLDYDAVYVVGGKGAMFDLPFDPALQDLILDLYKRNNTVIASVCHGPAAFVNVKDQDKYILEGVEVTSFCNLEEYLFGKKWVKEFPFKLEDKLKERGAKFTHADFMLNHVKVSGKFVTGQNPFSTATSAEAVLKSLGITPMERDLYRDEKSVNLIKSVLHDEVSEEQAQKLLKENTISYDIDLMAVWGYYKMMSAKENQKCLKKGIQIVELIQPYYLNNDLTFFLAQKYLKIGEIEKAKSLLEKLSSEGLLKEKVSELLKKINTLQSDKTEEISIQNTLLNYINGTSYTNAKLLEKAFHKNANLFLDKEGEDLWMVPIQEYISWYDKANSGKYTGRIGNILNIDHFNGIATAKAEIIVPKKNLRYIDMFLLKKVSDKWKIISKTASSESSHKNQNKILFIVSNVSFHGNSSLPTGNSFSEIVNAYDTFNKAGFSVDFVSPKGGSVPLAYINTSDSIHKKFLYNRDFMYKLKNTKRPDQVIPKNYKAVHYIGGGSAMYDVPINDEIQKISMTIYEEYNGIISSVCHGTAGIVNLKTKDGTFLVEGTIISGYPEAYEKKDALYFQQFPFLIQKTIEDRGGIFKYAPRNEPYVEVQGNIITGQNYLSSKSVALKIIENIMNRGS